ncbi:hypothetical protein Dfer_0859 [Dyadobacter fermentans DSM 18053]|uniref:Uncharacterized protein n=1 Tax=Dyadobacter fermentans (strain ATCC 700827 / DSM 18053 / CIP 107007 / KCTC 52180 / NS114) TaxID=471854 RepID=C6W2E1_DYAFD|nr:hypothetical protein Dfer_0859 [Dyadobacter fermentans DSM 18053]
MRACRRKGNLQPAVEVFGYIFYGFQIANAVARNSEKQLMIKLLFNLIQSIVDDVTFVVERMQKNHTVLTVKMSDVGRFNIMIVFSF